MCIFFLTDAAVHFEENVAKDESLLGEVGGEQILYIFHRSFSYYVPSVCIQCVFQHLSAYTMAFSRSRSTYDYHLKTINRPDIFNATYEVQRSSVFFSLEMANEGSHW